MCSKNIQYADSVRMSSDKIDRCHLSVAQTFIILFLNCPDIQRVNISYSIHHELLSKIEYVCRIPKGFGMEQTLTQFAV